MDDKIPFCEMSKVDNIAMIRDKFTICYGKYHIQLLYFNSKIFHLHVGGMAISKILMRFLFCNFVHIFLKKICIEKVGLANRGFRTHLALSFGIFVREEEVLLVWLDKVLVSLSSSSFFHNSSRSNSFFFSL